MALDRNNIDKNDSTEKKLTNEEFAITLKRINSKEHFELRSDSLTPDQALQVIQAFYSTGVISVKGNTLASLAFYCKCLPAVLWLEKTAPRFIKDNEWIPCLFSSIQANYLEGVDFCITKKSVSPVAELNGYNALQQAAECGHLGIVNYLLSKKINPDVTGKFQTSALSLAVRSNHLSVAEALIKAGANWLQADGSSSLGLAIKDNKIGFIKLALAHGFNIKSDISNGCTALLIAAAVGNIEILNYLLANGASLTERTVAEGADALLLAVQENQFDMVQYLIEYQGCDVNSKNNYGSNALTTTIKHNNLTLAKYLIAKGIAIDEIDSLGRTLLLKAVSQTNIEFVKLFLNPQHINLKTTIEEKLYEEATGQKLPKDQIITTPLLVACKRGDISITELLL